MGAVGEEEGNPKMHRRMARAGAAVAAVASLGMGGGLVLADAVPAGAATTAAPQPNQTIVEIFTNTEALLNDEGLQSVASVVTFVETVVTCFNPCIVR